MKKFLLIVCLMFITPALGTYQELQNGLNTYTENDPNNYFIQDNGSENYISVTIPSTVQSGSWAKIETSISFSENTTLHLVFPYGHDLTTAFWYWSDFLTDDLVINGNSVCVGDNKQNCRPTFPIGTYNISYQINQVVTGTDEPTNSNLFGISDFEFEPTIDTWGNNYTNNNNLSFTVTGCFPTSSIKFNVTASTLTSSRNNNLTIEFSVDSGNITYRYNTSSANFTTYFTTNGIHTVTARAYLSESGEYSNSKTWTINIIDRSYITNMVDISYENDSGTVSYYKSTGVWDYTTAQRELYPDYDINYSWYDRTYLTLSNDGLLNKNINLSLWNRYGLAQTQTQTVEIYTTSYYNKSTINWTNQPGLISKIVEINLTEFRDEPLSDFMYNFWANFSINTNSKYLVVVQDTVYGNIISGFYTDGTPFNLTDPGTYNGFAFNQYISFASDTNTNTSIQPFTSCYPYSITPIAASVTLHNEDTDVMDLFWVFLLCTICLIIFVFASTVFNRR